MATVSVQGADAIDAELARFDLELRERTLAKAMRKAGRIGTSRAKTKAPDGDGVGGDPDFPDLKKSIKSQTKRKGTVTTTTVATTAEARQGHLVEFGHLMVVGGTLKSGKGRIVGRVSPNPFWRPAQDEAEPHQEQAIIDELTRLADQL